MRRLALVAALPLLLAACGGSAGQGSGGGSGLQGKVTRGPVSPTCQLGKSCSAPARGLTLTFSKDGGQAVLARTKTGKDGAYRVDLPPGIYFVMGEQSVKPQQVTVPRGRYARVDFSYDTKIR